MARAFFLRDLDPGLALAGVLPAPLTARTDGNAPVGLAASAQLREKTQGGVSTVTHVMPIGFDSNAVKSAAGKRGSMMGSVLLAIEVNDATTNELLFAAVRREAPDALDIPATISTEATVKAVAERVGKRLERAMRRSG